MIWLWYDIFDLLFNFHQLDWAFLTQQNPRHAYVVCKASTARIQSRHLQSCKVGKPVHSASLRPHTIVELVLHFNVLFGSHYILTVASDLAGLSQSTATKYAAVLSPDKQEPASSDLHIVSRSDNQVYIVWRGCEANASHQYRPPLP